MSKNDLLRYSLFFACALVITWFIPKRGKFKYEYEEGKPWHNEDLAAPFTFSIRKSPTEIKEEQQELRSSFKPFYNRDKKVAELKKDRLLDKLRDIYRNDLKLDENGKKYLLLRGAQLLDDFYARGIICLDSVHMGKSKDFMVAELNGNEAKDVLLQEYYTLPEARNLALQIIGRDSLINRPGFAETFAGALDCNILYDKVLSEKRLNELLSAIAPTRGMVRQGEMIVTQGSIVTPQRYNILNSLKEEYEAVITPGYKVFIGYLVIILTLFVLYLLSLRIFNEESMLHIRSSVMVLLNILLFTGLTAFFLWKQTANVLLIPYCLVPILLLAFFGVRLAALTHLLVVIICGLFVPNPAEFMLLQFAAGFTAILSMARIRYVSQFFISALLIFMTYCLVELGTLLIKSGISQQMDWRIFMWFGGNFILLLLAYPLIYANEKIFGFLSDISLLELADLDNKLLRELFLHAPGTFQHSLQVANLSEAVIDRIGGNALLTRVGALYHDIGKLYNPEFFIENQKQSVNPHEGLSDVQNAELIIRHVTRGIEIGHEYHLPRKVIDFIRSHHGTTRVEYYYRHYLLDHEGGEVDETVFRYPGPKPASKEAAVVMICDSVEAASRSLERPDDKQLDNLVDKIIDSKIQDNQLDYATVTIQELNNTRRILKKLLRSIHHIRIQYPTEAETEKKV